MPELTVVIPTKDRPGLLSRALSSVLPHVDDAEVVVVDDGSAAGNAAAVRETCARDERIRLLRNNRSVGPSSARNRGLSVARGRYVSILDDDNMWTAGKWKRQRAALEAAGDAPDVVSVMAVRAVHLPSPRANDRPHVREPRRLRPIEELFRTVSPRVFLTTFAMPLALLREIGGWDDRLRWGEHTDLLIRTAKVARFTGTDEVGVIEDKKHDQADRRAGRNYPARVHGIDLLLEKHHREFDAEPGLRAVYLDVRGIAQLRCGDRPGAMSTFREVVLTAPTLSRRLRAARHYLRAAVSRGGSRSPAESRTAIQREEVP